MDEERFGQLEKRIESLETEIRELKAALVTKQQGIVSSNEKKPKQTYKRENWEHLTERKEKVDFEKQLTETWLPRIFMIVLLLGVLWGFKVAIDYGVITPFVRILIGFAAGFLISYLGYKQINAKRDKLGIILFGGAYSILLFTTFAASVLYGYIPSGIAFSLNMIWLAGGLYSSAYYRSQSLGIFIALGGYFIPFLIGSSNPNSLIFTIYETLLYVVLLYFSLRKQFMLLYFISFATLHFTFFVFLLTTFSSSSIDTTPLVYGIIVQFLFILIMYVSRDIYLKQQMTILFTSYMLTVGWVQFGIEPLAAELFSYITTGLLLGITILFYKRNQEKMVTLSIVSAVAVIISFSYLVGAEWLSFISLVEGTALLYLGWYFKAQLQKLIGGFIYTMAFLSSIEKSVYSWFSIDSLIWFTVLVTISAILYGAIKYEDKSKIIKWGVATATIFSWLRYTTFMVPLLLQGVNENVVQMANSFVWAILAVLVITVGLYKNIKVIRLVGIALLFITLLKVIVIDLFMVSIAIRAILFMGIGAIGILVSRMFYKR